MPADRILAGKESSCIGLIDNGHTEAGCRIAVCKLTAGKQWRLHCREEPRAGSDKNGIVSFGDRLPGRNCWFRPSGDTQRRVRRNAGRCDARYVQHFVEYVRGKGRSKRIKVDQQHTFGFET